MTYISPHLRLLSWPEFWLIQELTPSFRANQDKIAKPMVIFSSLFFNVPSLFYPSQPCSLEPLSLSTATPHFTAQPLVFIGSLLKFSSKWQWVFWWLCHTKRERNGAETTEGRIIINLTKQRKLKLKYLQRDMPKTGKAVCLEEPMKKLKT